MEINWNDDDFEYFVELPLGNQTFYMAFQEEDSTSDTVYFNVQMSLYSKKKHMVNDMDSIKTTGKCNPIETFKAAVAAFRELEVSCLEGFNEENNVVIYVRWSDRRRRDIYTRFLSKYDYRIGRDRDNEKCLFRKYKKGSYFNGEL